MENLQSMNDGEAVHFYEMAHGLNWMIQRAIDTHRKGFLLGLFFSRPKTNQKRLYTVHHLSSSLNTAHGFLDLILDGRLV